MTKDYKYDYNAVLGNTAGNWKLHTANQIVLVDNNGKSPIRVDKILCQLSIVNGFTSPKVFAGIIHLSDATGAFFYGLSGVMSDDNFTSALVAWKENIWMTDIRLLGTSTDEQLTALMEFDADTKRIL